MPKSKFQTSGFTLIEVIISIAIITTVLITAIGLISFSITSIRVNKSKIIATGLAQEGLELVKNIRDNNWLHNCPTLGSMCDRRTVDTWRIGLEAGDSRVQYNLENLLPFNPVSPVPLRIDSNGFYQYDNGSDTPFYRRINIEHMGVDQIKVTAEVTWVERGSTQSVSAETRYYNWLKEW